MAKKKKVRVELRKNRAKPPRPSGWTRNFHEHGYEEEATLNDERVRAKGDLSRHRTIIQDETAGDTGKSAASDMPVADTTACLPGRVLRVHGLWSMVELADGRVLRCAVRRVLRTLSTDERSIVTTGDKVWVTESLNEEGCIERIEPRAGVLTRASRGREHVLVANVEQIVIVVSLVEPELKPHLIDRYLVSAGQGRLSPIVCLNKADRVDPFDYQVLLGMYGQLGIPTFLTSANSGLGIDRLRNVLRGRASVIAGQSGVGKSSLLNALQPGLALRVGAVSEVNQKGKHTTTTSQLLTLDFGGWVVDTPGIRQLQLWQIRPGEVEGYFPELRPLVPLCGFPDCTHTHEERCAVKKALDRGQIATSRYESYLGLLAGSEEVEAERD